MPVKSTRMLIVKNQNQEVLLEKRPPSGIWGGLWAFPQIETDQDLYSYCRDKYTIEPSRVEHWQPYRHTFSHYHLDISPTIVELPDAGPLSNRIMESAVTLWYNINQPPKIGLAAPIKKLIGKLAIPEST